jgi:indolepyruvate decarboxylase
VIIAGVELHRWGLQSDVVNLAEASGIAMASTMLAKSVVSETHPLYIGLYEGAMGRDEVTEVRRGERLRDPLGHDPHRHRPGHLHRQTRRREQHLRRQRQAANQPPSFRQRAAGRLHPGAGRGQATRGATAAATRPRRARGPYVLQPDVPITTRRLVRRLDESLDDRTIVIADVGDALFASSELVIRGQTEYIAPAYYTSMGFAVPAALGAQMARPDLKVVTLVGDGAFQMTGMELSTIVKRGLPVTVIVLDNKGYGTERLLLEGSFNDINPWQYQLLPQVLGGGTGWEVRTEGEFDTAITRALADTTGMNIIRVHIGLEDRSTTLDRLAAGLAKKVAR